MRRCAQRHYVRGAVGVDQRPVVGRLVILLVNAGKEEQGRNVRPDEIRMIAAAGHAARRPVRDADFVRGLLDRSGNSAPLLVPKMENLFKLSRPIISKFSMALMFSSSIVAFRTKCRLPTGPSPRR